MSHWRGGCFSISSLGGIGGTAFTPIINAPEVAILGVSKSATKPVWDGKAFQPQSNSSAKLGGTHYSVPKYGDSAARGDHASSARRDSGVVEQALG